MDSSRKVTKYTAHPGAIVWINYKDKWFAGVIKKVIRTKLEVTFKHNEKEKNIMVHYEDLMYRKLEEKEPPKEK